jgi:hypothetical protein
MAFTLAVVVSLAGIMSVLPSCSLDDGRGFLAGARGEEIRWKPSAPQIGDLVEVDVFVPGLPVQNGSESSGRLQDAGGTGPVPLSVQYTSGGVRLRWAFRMERPGDWFFSPLPEKSEPLALWTVATLAGDEDALKEIDAQAAWLNKKLPPAAPRSNVPPLSGAAP